jgi:hypothetical protein
MYEERLHETLSFSALEDMMKGLHDGDPRINLVHLLYTYFNRKWRLHVKSDLEILTLIREKKLSNTAIIIY